MSTIALNPKRFADIAASLRHHTAGITRDRAPLLAGAILDALKIPVFAGTPETTHAAALNALVFDWARLNGAAWATRYRSATRPEVCPDFLLAGQPLALLPLLKALDCLHYNCDNGRDHSDSLARLAALQKSLCSHLVRFSHAYEKSGWDDAKGSDYFAHASFAGGAK